MHTLRRAERGADAPSLQQIKVDNYPILCMKVKVDGIHGGSEHEGAERAGGGDVKRRSADPRRQRKPMRHLPVSGMFGYITWQLLSRARCACARGGAQNAALMHHAALMQYFSSMSPASTLVDGGSANKPAAAKFPHFPTMFAPPSDACRGHKYAARREAAGGLPVWAGRESTYCHAPAGGGAQRAGTREQGITQNMRDSDTWWRSTGGFLPRVMCYSCMPLDLAVHQPSQSRRFLMHSVGAHVTDVLATLLKVQLEETLTCTPTAAHERRHHGVVPHQHGVHREPWVDGQYLKWRGGGENRKGHARTQKAYTLSVAPTAPVYSDMTSERMLILEPA
ncbi:hypothetical protein GGX14DRAFT_387379 [Mycena pura]|uniref:Uncharacterized protein n=1 Tax=Mycena pura TaxID=153505 RepID=A0AAD7E3A9_9AGAR|nr:hypothetical protein GGX14DRAFT_387379 [Mycena pura]